MRSSIHQHQDDQYPHPASEEAIERKRREDNDVADPRPRDITENENITEVDEAAGSAEGMANREDEINLRMDVREDREDNNEERLSDVPPSAVHQ